MKRVCNPVLSNATSNEAVAHANSSIRPGSVTSASGLSDTHDLEQHKVMIGRLFIGEDRPLVEVMEIMKTRYNVTAS